MHNTLYTWRIFCNTENQWVYKDEDSSKTIDAVCFNNPSHSVDTSSLKVVLLEQSNGVVAENLPVTPFDEIRTSERTLVMELKSAFGKTPFRDTFTELGTGTIVNNVGDNIYTLNVSGANDKVILKTRERSRYKSGVASEAGVAVLLNQASLTGNQIGKFGLFNGTDGFYFKFTSTGLKVAVLRNNVEIAIDREDWNYDRLDGTGPSRHVFNFFKSNMFEFIYSLQGAGSINFYVNCINSTTNLQGSWLVHTYFSETTTAVSQPNLPIAVELDNAGTQGARTVLVSGRHYCILGRYTPIYRLICEYRGTKSIGTTANFIPLISIRRKTGYAGLPIRINSFDIIATTNMFIEIRIGAVLTGASFGNLTDVSADDTGVESDKSATAMTGGFPVFCGIASGNIQLATAVSKEVGANLNEYEILTLCAKEITTTNGSVSASVLRWEEEW